MNIKNLKLKISSRGEIATILTILSLGLMLLGAVAGTKLATTPQQTKTLASYPDWKWDEAAGKCADSDNKGFCICQNLGVPNAGFCTPACKSEGSQKCIANKWADPNDANAWGCWGDSSLDCRAGMASPVPTGPTPTGPTLTPVPGGGSPPPACTAGEWKCNNNEANSDTKNLFCSVWCDGRNQWLFEASKVYFAGDGTKCGGMPSKPRSEGCPTTPTPTGKPPGNPPNVPPVVPPVGGGTDPKPGGFIVVNGDSIYSTKEIKDVKYIQVIPNNFTATEFTTYANYLYIDVTKSETVKDSLGDNIWLYTLDKAYTVIQLVPNVLSSLPVKLKYLKGDRSDVEDGREDAYGNLSVCYLPNITPVPDDNLNNAAQATTIINSCGNYKNTIKRDFSNPLAPEPPKDTTKSVLTFNIRMNNQTGDSQYRVVLADQSCDKTSLPECNYSGISVTDGSNKLSTDHPDKIYVKPFDKIKVAVSLDPDTEKVVINMIGDLYHNEEIDKKYIDNRVLKGTVKVSCLLQDIPLTLNKGGDNNDLGDLIQIDMNKDSCSIIKIIGSKDTFLGSANADFQKVMDDYSQGKLSAIDVSRFVSQLTRVPGLQTVTCNPTRGECNPGF